MACNKCPDVFLFFVDMSGKDRAKKFRENHPEYRIAEIERMRNKRVNITESEKEMQRKRDRDRKRCKRQHQNSEMGLYATPQSFGKAVSKVMKSLPEDESRMKDVMVEVNRRVGLRVINAKNNSEFVNRQSTSIASIQQFYVRDDISRQAPGMKDVSISKETKEKKQTRHMFFTLKEAFGIFKTECPDTTIKFSTFAASRPFNVKLQRDIPENVCVCAIHSNFHFMLDILSKLLGQSITPEESFLCCQSSEDCMFLTCENCGWDKYNTVSTDWLECVSGDTEVVYEQWFGGIKESVSSTFSDFLEKFRSSLPGYLRHCYVKRVQSHHFQYSISNMEDDCVVMQVSQH
jgi:hypothetical protein